MSAQLPDFSPTNVQLNLIKCIMAPSSAELDDLVIGLRKINSGAEETKGTEDSKSIFESVMGTTSIKSIFTAQMVEGQEKYIKDLTAFLTSQQQNELLTALGKLSSKIQSQAASRAKADPLFGMSPEYTPNTCDPEFSAFMSMYKRWHSTLATSTADAVVFAGSTAGNTSTLASLVPTPTPVSETTRVAPAKKADRS